MSETHDQLIQLKANLDRLLRNFTAVKNENDLLKQQIDAQRKSLADKNHKISELDQQLSLSKTSKLLTDTDDLSKQDKSEVRQKINDLIKEVDKCIAMMNT